MLSVGPRRRPPGAPAGDEPASGPNVGAGAGGVGVGDASSIGEVIRRG